MITPPFEPTPEQKAIIGHNGCAFVTACPGAGKTRTMVERARVLLESKEDKRGMAFLSFTTAAVEELESRLRSFCVLPVPLFPSFIGTFDSFLWQFLIAPFGIPGCSKIPKLVPDKADWEVIPFSKAQPLPLRCFDRSNGKINPALAKKYGFDTANRSSSAHETSALKIIEKSQESGRVDFDDIRACVNQRLNDPDFNKKIGIALSGRFREIVVDEAQDCNPSDLAIIEWLRSSGIVLKVICDPNQSIYEFRGGVTKEIQKFSETFDPADRLPMSGNFRSNAAVCSAIVMLRPPSLRATPDTPLGRHRNDTNPVQIISYAGSTVSAKIGAKFTELVEAQNIPLHAAPVLASTRASAAKAIDQPILEGTNDMTLSLAEAVMNYHFSFTTGNVRTSLIQLHRVILLVRGSISALGDYHTYLVENSIEDHQWRPEVIALAKSLRSSPSDTPDKWLGNARALLAPSIVGSSTINQRLRNNSKLASVLTGIPAKSCPARTIHSVKGMEFPAVCVVLTKNSCGKILDYLEGEISDSEEDARKIYVGSSRAETFLAIAVPKSQVARLKAHLLSGNCPIQVHDI